MKDPTRREVARILRAIAKKVEEGQDEGAAMDLNGNRVGSFWFQPVATRDGQPSRGHDFLLKIETDNAAFQDE